MNTSTPSTADMSWDSLRREARQLESEIDAKLVEFSKLGADYSSRSYRSDDGSSDGRNYDSTAADIQQLLMRDASAAVRHTAQRHREILNEYTREFNKTKASIRATRDRADLLSSVQRDINTYRSVGNERQDLYLKEHDHLKSSTRLTEDAIGLAVNAKEALLSQRAMFSNISQRMAGVFQRFPVMNSVMQKINVKKRKDSLVLGGVIATCIILILLYVMH